MERDRARGRWQAEQQADRRQLSSGKENVIFFFLSHLYFLLSLSASTKTMPQETTVLKEVLGFVFVKFFLVPVL